ncbi:MAG TPA: acyl-CoA dehydrogenase family protein [Ramlibacter sp.]|uniref:acyl-CoA dehydrogenase family protein n=1 Tax=Ramlibacter sp. TaxID=1917967 RepID=UPI002B603C89|nr:acyl-CoA dehydrogenase family protein [Ramlibacter sp.]HVZ46517.1 acyl-CoA dehydrogenase family protein [Ramlibacter sp.]
MEFELTDTQEMLRSNVRRLVSERHGFEQRKAFIAKAQWSPLWSDFAQMGLLGAEIDEAHGGSAGSLRDLGVVLEELGRGLVVDPFIETVVLGAGLVSRAGSARQRDNLLPRVVAGQLKFALAYVERDSRYSLERIETSASETSGGGYVIVGRKCAVLGAADADLLIVSARTGKGLSLFVVPRTAPGVAVHDGVAIDGKRSAEVSFHSVRVTAADVLGAPHEGLQHLEWAIDRGAIAVCYDSLGAMTALNALTGEYLRTRQQFGRPIGSFQALQHRFADMNIAEQLARSIVPLTAADYADTATRCQAVSAAKVQVGASAQIVGRGAIQLHGGIGVTLEYAAGHYFRRLAAAEMMYGDSSFHLERYARLSWAEC